jgi:hypothetical protein
MVGRNARPALDRRTVALADGIHGIAEHGWVTTPPQQLVHSYREKLLSSALISPQK